MLSSKAKELEDIRAIVLLHHIIYAADVNKIEG